MAETRSDWVEIVEPRSRERMYVNLATGECGWAPPSGAAVRQCDGGQWWELFDDHNKRFYYYNSASQQTVWHRPPGCDVVPLAQLQAMKRSSRTESRRPIGGGVAGEGRRAPPPGAGGGGVYLAPLPPEAEGGGRTTPTKGGDGDGLESKRDRSRDPAQKWQPAPGSKAAMLVKVNSIGRNQSGGLAGASHFLHLSPNVNASTAKPAYQPLPQLHPLQSPTLCKMPHPGDPKQGFHRKKPDNADFCLVPPNPGGPPYAPPSRPLAGASSRPSSPPYASGAPIYDEPPPDNPIYDEPPVEMEIEGSHPSERRSSSTYAPPPHGAQRSPSPFAPNAMLPKLLPYPVSKHKRTASAAEYSPAGRECIKHMVNVEPPAPRLASGPQQSQTLPAGETASSLGEPQIQAPASLPAQTARGKQGARHSRQSSLASQEYPGPPAVTHQDSGYSTGPSPSLRRKNRRRAAAAGYAGSAGGNAPGVRPGSAGSAGELSALNEKLMAEMRAAVSGGRPGPLRRHGSKASLDTDAGGSDAACRSPAGGNRGDGAIGTATAEEAAGGGRQKRTYEKVDSLEKSETSQTSLSSIKPPTSPSQTGTLDSQTPSPDDDPNIARTAVAPDNSTPTSTTTTTTTTTTDSPTSPNSPTSAPAPRTTSAYQYPYATLRPLHQPTGPDSSMADWAQKNLNQHTQGLFRRRLSLANMLSWSGGSIRKPMLVTSDRAVKKEACELFKLVQIYMWDRPSRPDRRQAALMVVTKCWSRQGLRDEAYVQLVRQTTANGSARSLAAGWELMAICLAFFSPSPKFRRYLEGYIQTHLEPSNDKKILQHIMEQQELKNKKNSKSRKKRKQNNEEEEEQSLPISTYAKYCYRKLQKVAVTGGKKGLRKPTLEEIDHGRNAIVTPSLFGSALEEIMERQSERFPDRKLPWAQVQLSQCVLALGGAQTEGIFRVPGDIDEVNALKLQVDQWKIPEDMSDPTVPASLLKLWYRELEEPVIPQGFYKQCVSHCEEPEAAIRVVQSLPELSRLVLCYFIHFLQVFAQPVNVSKTKMDVNNLAMVMAPNCLRCQSDDPRVIFENTRKEMSFLRVLIVHLDTSFIQGVV